MSRVERAEQQNTSIKRSNAPKRKRPGKHSKYRAYFRLALILIAAIFLIVMITKAVRYLKNDTDVRLTDDGYTHAAQFDDCIVINGIDVSEFQTADISWGKAKTSGADFVFVRAAYRVADTGELKEDSLFEDNIEEAEDADMMVGAYIYSQAVTTEEAEEEAEFLMDLVEDYNITMPLVIDYELYEGGRLEQAVTDGELYAASQFNDIVLAFCERVHEEGYEAGVYGNTNMFTNYMDASLIGDEANFWLAEYSVSASYDGDYTFWQCSQEAEAGGIDGYVDHDFWYVEPGKVYETRASGSLSQVSISECDVIFESDTVSMENHKAVPNATVHYEGKAMREGTDYVISYINNTSPGTGYAVVCGINGYKDWTTVPFTIED